MERINLVNEQMRLRANPDSHRLTARDDLVKSRAFIDYYQKAFFNHSEALEKRINHLGVTDSGLDVAGRKWKQHIKSLNFALCWDAQ